MAPEIDRTPPYLQVVADLRKRIVSGELAEGDTLPSVRRIAQEWQISTATALKALGGLKADGLAEAVPGIGTVVRTRRNLHRTAADRLTKMLETGKIYAEGEYAKITEAGLSPAPAWIADLLGIDEGAHAVRRRRVTYGADHVPVGASTSWFSPDLAEAVPALTLTERIPGGTPSAIEAATGKRGVHTDDAYTAAAATEDQATDLQVEVGSPVTIGRNVFLDADGGVIEVGEYVAPAGRWATRSTRHS
jgi:DNA-binding GntR family transcriptional regulator